MWSLRRNTLACIVMLSLVFFSNTSAEAGVFWWFNKIEVQVSPEIKGAVMLHGKPQANMQVKRGTFFEDSWSWDSTYTDAEGHFYFAEKVIQAREVLHERQVAVQLLAVDYPSKGNEDLFFRIGASHNLKTPSVALLTDGMLCELSADYEMSYLKLPEFSDTYRHGFKSKCRFLHAEKIIVSQAELDASELQSCWEDVYRLLSFLEQKAENLQTDQYARHDIQSLVKSGEGLLQRIAELEPSAEKRNTLPRLKQQIQSYLELLDKEELP